MFKVIYSSKNALFDLYLFLFIIISFGFIKVLVKKKEIHQ